MKKDLKGDDDLFPNPCDSLVLGEACTLCQEAGLGFVGRDIIWGNGARNPRLMVVGMESAPPKKPSLSRTRNEGLWLGSRITRMPMTNRNSGLKLRRRLTTAGWDMRSEVFITNTVKCNVGNDEHGLKYEVLANICVNYLRRELAIGRPNIVITLGENASELVQGLWASRTPLPMPGFDQKVTLAYYSPFTGAFSLGTEEQGESSEIEVFPLRHPAARECPDVPYVAALRAIRARLP